jgi:hypothetical protein
VADGSSGTGSSEFECLDFVAIGFCMLQFWFSNKLGNPIASVTEVGLVA